MLEGEIETARTLLREYAAHLIASAGEQHLCLANYEKELAGLPAPYAGPRGAILLAYEDGVPAGIVAIKPVAREGACEMKRLWVRPQFRGRGIGRSLSERAIETARSLGYSSLYLDTLPASMPEANRLYLDLGFTEVEPYNNNPPEVVCFRRGL